MYRQVSDRWLRSPQRDSQAIQRSDPIRLRLFCFPYAGGGASFYRTWSQILPPSVEVCPVQLPGRESRMDEKPFSHLAPLVNTIARVLRPFLDLPFAFFGYSFGALVAFELAREIRWQYRLNPSHLFVAAFPAPQLPRPDSSIHNLPQPEFVDGLRRFNAMPEEVLQNPDLLDLFLPILRADFAAYETYSYELEPPLECPISVFGGLNDRNIDHNALEAWREQTRSYFSLRMFSGKHFFLFNNQKQLVQAVSVDLSPLLNLPVRGSSE
jgi:medium-chain acyl-[acyl-carrier-protein] hydrolase